MVVATRPHYPPKVFKHTRTHIYRGSGEGCVDLRMMLAVQANRRSSKHVSYTTLSAPNKPPHQILNLGYTRKALPCFLGWKNMLLQKKNEWVAEIRLFLQLPCAERKRRRFRFLQVTNLPSIQVRCAPFQSWMENWLRRCALKTN